MKNLVIIEGDYFRADLIAAIEVVDMDMNVWVTGFENPFCYEFESVAGAEAAQVAAVRHWMNLP